MVYARDLSAESIQNTWERLTGRQTERRAQMMALEPYRHLILSEMQSDLWRDRAPNFPQWTLPSVYIAATTDTVVSFLTGKNPVFNVVPLDPTMNSDSRAANKIERAMGGIFHEINCYRDVPIQMEVAESAVHRGHIIGRYMKLSDEDAGIVAEETGYVYDTESQAAIKSETIVDYGEFPVEVEIYDPLDCAWSLGRRGQTAIFVHKTLLYPDALCDLYPDIHDKEGFGDIDWESDSQIEVYDYWDAKQNAIVINGQYYKEPTAHNYRTCPVVIELVRPTTIRRQGRDYSVREGQPFCATILESVRGLSWAQSMTASHLDEVGMASLVLKGIDPQPNRSPYWKIGRNGKPVFQMVVEVGPNSRIIPTFGSEQLDYLDPPRLAEIYGEFRMDRLRDIQMSTFAESLLSGAQMVELSGYAYNQIKQAAISRVVPPRLAMDRWFGRTFTGVVHCIVDEWPYGGSELILRLDNGRSEFIALSELEAVRSVEVEIKPDIPVDVERELQVWFNAKTLGAASLERVMGHLPGGGVEDPDLELGRIAYETEALTNPQIRSQLTAYYMRRNKITPSGQPQTGAQAMAPSGGMIDPNAVPMGQGGPMQLSPAAAPQALGPAQPQMGMGPAPAPAPMGGGLDPQLLQFIEEVRPMLPPELAQLPPEQLVQDPRFMEFVTALQAQAQGGGMEPGMGGPPPEQGMM